jgi:hypothetical protein
MDHVLYGPDSDRQSVSVPVSYVLPGPSFLTLTFDVGENKATATAA